MAGKKSSNRTGLLVIISGASGAGKDAVIKRVKDFGLSFHHAVTATTRPRRPDEVEGSDYYFISREQFEQMIQRDELLEWAEVYGNLYGVPSRKIMNAIDRGEDVLIRVDVQGAETIKKSIPEAVLVFLSTPSIEDHHQRLKLRQTESDDDMNVRMDAVTSEMRSIDLFDYLVVNRQGELDTAAMEVMCIVIAERCRLFRRIVSLKESGSSSVFSES